MKLADLERHLRLHGCVLKRQGGHHAIWEDHATGDWTSVPRHREGVPEQIELPRQGESCTRSGTGRRGAAL